MTTIDIKDVSGKKAGSADLAPSVFGIEPNVHVMHHVVRAQRASWRQGSRGARRAPAAPARVPSALPSGRAAAPCSGRIRAPTR